MKKDLKFFMREHKEEIVTVPGPDTIVDENGKPVMLEIKVLSQEAIQEIHRRYTSRTMALDKNKRPYIVGGEVAFKTEKDNDRAARHIMVESLVYPNLKDAALMDYYKCVDVVDMPLKVFADPKEYAHVTNAILTALGIMGEPEDDGETLEEAKN